VKLNELKRSAPTTVTAMVGWAEIAFDQLPENRANVKSAGSTAGVSRCVNRAATRNLDCSLRGIAYLPKTVIHFLGKYF
jgi:hypothetical protein